MAAIGKDRRGGDEEGQRGDDLRGLHRFSRGAVHDCQYLKKLGNYKYQNYYFKISSKVGEVRCSTHFKWADPCMFRYTKLILN